MNSKFICIAMALSACLGQSASADTVEAAKKSFLAATTPAQLDAAAARLNKLKVDFEQKYVPHEFPLLNEKLRSLKAKNKLSADFLDSNLVCGFPAGTTKATNLWDSDKETKSLPSDIVAEFARKDTSDYSGYSCVSFLIGNLPSDATVSDRDKTSIIEYAVSRLERALKPKPWPDSLVLHSKALVVLDRLLNRSGLPESEQEKFIARIHAAIENTPRDRYGVTTSSIALLLLNSNQFKSKAIRHTLFDRVGYGLLSCPDSWSYDSGLGKNFLATMKDLDQRLAQLGASADADDRKLLARTYTESAFRCGEIENLNKLARATLSSQEDFEAVVNGAMEADPVKVAARHFYGSFNDRVDLQDLATRIMDLTPSVSKQTKQAILFRALERNMSTLLTTPLEPQIPVSDSRALMIRLGELRLYERLLLLLPASAGGSHADAVMLNKALLFLEKTAGQLQQLGSSNLNGIQSAIRYILVNRVDTTLRLISRFQINQYVLDSILMQTDSPIVMSRRTRYFYLVNLLGQQPLVNSTAAKFLSSVSLADFDNRDNTPSKTLLYQCFAEGRQKDCDSKSELSIAAYRENVKRLSQLGYTLPDFQLNRVDLGYGGYIERNR